MSHDRAKMVPCDRCDAPTVETWMAGSRHNSPVICASCQSGKLAAENATLRRTVTALRAALEKYGTHRRDCTPTYAYAGAEPTCTCGLTAALETPHAR